MHQAAQELWQIPFNISPDPRKPNYTGRTPPISFAKRNQADDEARTEARILRWGAVLGRLFRRAHAEVPAIFRSIKRGFRASFRSALTPFHPHPHPPRTPQEVQRDGLWHHKLCYGKPHGMMARPMTTQRVLKALSSLQMNCIHMLLLLVIDGCQLHFFRLFEMGVRWKLRGHPDRALKYRSRAALGRKANERINRIKCATEMSGLLLIPTIWKWNSIQWSWCIKIHEQTIHPHPHRDIQKHKQLFSPLSLLFFLVYVSLSVSSPLFPFHPLPLSIILFLLFLPVSLARDNTCKSYTCTIHFLLPIRSESVFAGWRKCNNVLTQAAAPSMSPYL